MSISVFISWYNMEWSPELGKSVLYDNMFTYAMILALIILPFFICIFFTLRVDALHEDNFSRRYGALYSGLKYEDKKGLLTNRTLTMLFPLFFVLRRLIFSAAALFLSQYPVLQLISLYYVTTLMIIFLMWHMPFEEPWDNLTEVFNEVTTILLLYFMNTFSDFVPEASQRYQNAWFFIAILSVNILFHLSFLAKGILDELLLKCERRK